MGGAFLVVSRWLLYFNCYFLVIITWWFVSRSRYEVKRWNGYVMVQSTILIAYV